MKNNRSVNEECAEKQMRLNGECNLIKAKHIKRPHLKGRNTKSTQTGEILIRLTWKKRRFLYTRLDSILQSSLFSAHCIDASPVSLTWKLESFSVENRRYFLWHFKGCVQWGVMWTTNGGELLDSERLPPRVSKWPIYLLSPRNLVVAISQENLKSDQSGSQDAIFNSPTYTNSSLAL